MQEVVNSIIASLRRFIQELRPTYLDELGLVAALPNQVSLEIEDDGQGFVVGNDKTLVREGHFGLIGIRERAQLLNATYEIKSAVGQGTRICVRVPISNET